ncbi:MAG: AAA family ATPase [Bacteroidales bacterium]|nr:AAA family ATPase [Bacteroidales bacterium]
MDPVRFEQEVLTSLQYDPTPDQRELAGKFTRFLFHGGNDSLFLLKGYAGTGKTTLISAVIRNLARSRWNFVLLAPTGRAAKVLSSYSGQQASTIHKKLYWVSAGEDGEPLPRPAANRNADTLFIIDEASMIPGPQTADDAGYFSGRNLLDDLMQYVTEGRNCRLVLVGDTAQLPPVGLEVSPAMDEKYLKARYHVQVFSYELTEVVRQEHDSGILHNATLIREMIGRQQGIPRFDLNSYRDLRRIGGYELEEYLQSAFYSMDASAVIVTRSNKRAVLYNREVRRRIFQREGTLSAGDTLMVVRNNYFWLPQDSGAGFIANGDILEVRRVSGTMEAHGFRFADVTVTFPDYDDIPPLETRVFIDTLDSSATSLGYSEIQTLASGLAGVPDGVMKRIPSVLKRDPFFQALQVKFAYALTCHKTQGGQWDSVFIDQGYITRDMINTGYLRWLYTAFTRATRKLYLVNFHDMFFGG